MAGNTAIARAEHLPVVEVTALETIGAAAGLGAQFEKVRQAAFSRLQTVPMPSGSHELWRYTKPEAFELKKLRDQAAVGFTLEPFKGESLPNGVELTTGEAAVRAAGAVFET